MRFELPTNNARIDSQALTCWAPVRVLVRFYPPAYWLRAYQSRRGSAKKHAYNKLRAWRGRALRCAVEVGRLGGFGYGLEAGKTPTARCVVLRLMAVGQGGMAPTIDTVLNRLQALDSAWPPVKDFGRFAYAAVPCEVKPQPLRLLPASINPSDWTKAALAEYARRNGYSLEGVK